ncbi:kinase-like domain-containing protein [Hygrophoropsis aurantiaca]|uniref:Kinase-like domain-containing protein n=1 Tax=Hygrophoropsis aurantiaca TaxID=72124 RepID=A0ACB7ZXB9_9AGAM|nr:kinase-like domain-containing protein [Hygrophoropsis aurantiaca]
MDPLQVGRLRGIHERGLIHGDVKPHNFCVPYRRSTLYAIDFEMTTAYPTKGGSFYGTAYWASVHALRKEPLSRRDDMHSLAYTLVGLIKETLPWENAVNDLDELTRVKASTTALELCDGLPQPCLEFVSHCLDLEFLQSPDYHFLSDCMQRLVS